VHQAANDGTWQAAAWWLERTQAEHFARQTKLDVAYVRQREEAAASEMAADLVAIIAREAGKECGCWERILRAAA
jgi:hypothetical protein